MARILIVEDDESIRNLIELTLMQFQYETVSFEDAETAWEYLKKNSADMGIFDLMLPGMTGLELIARIREDEHLSGLPVIILTAKDSELDKVIGLDQGADDYMTKPFSVLELTARIRSLMRRSGTSHSETHNFNEEGLNIDFDGRTVHVREQQVDLTYKEFELLKYLISHKGKAVSRQELLNQIWGYDFVGESRTLDVHINSLRRKLGEPYDGWIQVIRGVGYRFVQESNT
ncbi:MAG: response regulator transcription factor [Merdibacter sp.]|nr:response regulator transcription factor [Candidatus Merdibacter merdipullorum]